MKKLADISAFENLGNQSVTTFNFEEGIDLGPGSTRYTDGKGNSFGSGPQGNVGNPSTLVLQAQLIMAIYQAIETGKLSEEEGSQILLKHGITSDRINQIYNTFIKKRPGK